MSAAFAGVDVGGGGIRVQVEAVGGLAAYREDQAPVPRENGAIDLVTLAHRVAVAVSSACLDVGVDRLAGLGIGLTGLPGLVTRPADLWDALRTRLGLECLVVAGDALTTHVGALAFRQGVVVAAGTGVITLGTDLGSVWNRSDGWGYLLGDHGSGAWIGMQGLQAALRSHDGRAGGSRALLEALTARFGDPEELVALVYESSSVGHRLASFAPEVASAARSGDAVALRIWRSAGRHLGEAAVAAAVGLDPVFSWGGRLFEAADLLMEPFQATVRSRLPAARFVPPAATATDGALSLARRAAEGTLHERKPYLHVFQL